MKKVFTFLLLLMAFTSIGQGKLTFVKTLSTENVTSITPSMKYSTEIVSYDGDFIKLVISIETNTNESILRQLYKVGRYNVSIENGAISLININKDIYIKGEKLLEDILLEIKVPIGLELQIDVDELLN